jgi:hypothetical protein
MLPIRQTLNALPGLKRTEKAVLIEVCQLAENSEPAGWCTAKNDYLVQAHDVAHAHGPRKPRAACEQRPGQGS